MQSCTLCCQDWSQNLVQGIQGKTNMQHIRPPATSHQSPDPSHQLPVKRYQTSHQSDPFSEEEILIPGKMICIAEEPLSYSFRHDAHRSPSSRV